MELKSFICWLDGMTNKFKSHLYGIEIIFDNVELDAEHCLNRTFMELKYSIGSETYLPKTRLNRTFMELKYVNRSTKVGIDVV